jgi:hypothetical protein
MLVLSLDGTGVQSLIKLIDFGMSRESNNRHTIVGVFVEGTRVSECVRAREIEIMCDAAFDRHAALHGA